MAFILMNYKTACGTNRANTKEQSLHIYKTGSATTKKRISRSTIPQTAPVNGLTLETSLGVDYIFSTHLPPPPTPVV